MRGPSARQVFIAATLLLAATLAATVNVGASSAPKPSFKVYPSQIALFGMASEQSIVVVGKDAQGNSVDRTDDVKIASVTPKIVAVSGNVVTPVAQGTGEVAVTLDGTVSRIPVTVRANGSCRFLTDVQPVIFKAGCAQRMCHGAPDGQSGFHLSLFGYDAPADVDMIVHQSGGRRVDLANPAKSLILMKPTEQIGHGGGTRFAVGSPEYRAFKAWLTAGAPAPSVQDPELVKLAIEPAGFAFSLPDQKQRFLVTATFSNGRTADVTRLCRYETSDPGVAAVDAGGRVTALRRGEFSLIARYGRTITSAALFADLPFAKPDVATTFTPRNVVDEMLRKKWDKLGLVPSGPCTDSEFVRRAYLDVIGTLPTPAEAGAFVADGDPDKRSKLVDALIQRPEFAEFWAIYWCDLFRVNQGFMQPKGARKFRNWIRDRIADNEPLDQFAHDVLTGTGSNYQAGPPNYYLTNGSVEENAITFGNVFMGTRLDCANCHNHPRESWSQEDFYKLAAFFVRTNTKPGKDKDEEVVYDEAEGMETGIPNRKVETTVQATFPRTHRKADPNGNLRGQLAGWLLDKENQWFPRSVVNRVWAHFFGKGLYNPVDDYRQTNPSVAPELLDTLTRNFVAHGYDFQYLVRTIAGSAAYQISANTNASNAKDTRYFTHFYKRLLSAEVMADAIAQVTGVPDEYDGYDKGTRAIQVAEPEVSTEAMDQFGRPNRYQLCSRNEEPSLSQALYLQNSGDLMGKIGSDNGRVAALVGAGKSPEEITTELFLAALSRPPTPDELAAVTYSVQSLYASQASPPSQGNDGSQTDAPSQDGNGGQADGSSQGGDGNQSDAPTPSVDPRPVYEDAIWALINTREFQFQH